MDPAPDRPLADSAPASWVERAPPRLRPFLRLARYDRPIGIWLLAGPSWLGIALANIDGEWRFLDLVYAVLLGIGSIAMRGAGCTFNDIVDKDLDAQVARTADRPLPAGTVSVRDAWLFLATQCAVGLLVLALLPRAAQIAALASIPVVAAYPFMKRITWFPQAWLGIALNWGVLVGFTATTGGAGVELWIVFAALAAWTFGYDTIYAHQDKEDDALVGVKSTARLFGGFSRWAVIASYEVATVLLLVGALVAAIRVEDEAARYTAAAAGMLTSVVFAIMLVRQVIGVRFDDPASCLAWFRTNRDAILAAAAVLAIAPLALRPLFAGA
jgi:4-hydroxybenzoate polyprenyltransferase